MSRIALELAVTKAGGETALAAAIGCSRQRLAYWLTRERGAAAEFVLKIEAATGVSRHDLRDDIYPREAAA